MRRILLAALCLYSFASVAQVHPAENDTLNYRLIGFTIPVQEKPFTHVLEIASGRINNSFDFQKNIIITQTDTGRRFVVTVPAFGRDYTWRVRYLNKNEKEKEKSELRHFTVGTTKFVDTAAYKLKMITKNDRYKNMYLFTDAPPVMYNMDGEALWYLPGADNATEPLAIRDLKATSRGTLTFITDNDACEIDYDGHVLWKAPNDGRISGDSSEHYHHQLTRLSNGHYMVPGSKDDLVQVDGSDTALIRKEDGVKQINGGFFKTGSIGTLIEYDSAGRVVWHWNSGDYFGNKPLPSGGNKGEVNTKTHMNGFYFDEPDSTIYISFKFVSSILKIKYPSGQVLADYHGEKLFKYQHNCQLTTEGNIYLFNNNINRGLNGVSYLSMFRQPSVGETMLTKIWEFPCTIDEHAASGAGVGGSVYMLPDKAILASMGTAGRHFIVAPDKKVLWNGVSMSYIDNSWQPLRQYKNSIIENNEQLQELIFNQHHNEPTKTLR